MSSVSLVARSIIFSKVIAALVALVGGVVLVGWSFDIPILKSISPDMVSMKANTAISFLAAGVSLFLLAHEDAPNVMRMQISRLLAAIILVVAGLSLVQYALSINFGIDELLFVDVVGMKTSHPGRMAPVTAISLMMCALALLSIDRSSSFSCRIVLVAMVFALLGIAGYVFGVQTLYGVSGYTSMALHTAVTLVFLSLGIIAARPKHGWMAVILSDTTGGVMARRLLVTIPFLLATLGWLRFQGQLAGLYDDRFGLAMMVVMNIVFSAAIILHVAKILLSIDGQRRKANDQLTEFNANLEGIIAKRTNELENANQKLAAEIVEHSQAEAEVQRLSLTDELTGLLNRRGFFCWPSRT